MYHAKSQIFWLWAQEEIGNHTNQGKISLELDGNRANDLRIYRSTIALSTEPQGHTSGGKFDSWPRKFMMSTRRWHLLFTFPGLLRIKTSFHQPTTEYSYIKLVDCEQHYFSQSAQIFYKEFGLNMNCSYNYKGFLLGCTL